MQNNKPYRKLQGKIVEVYGSQRNFSDKIGLSDVSVTHKLSGKTTFRIDDIVKWSIALGITRDEVGNYFFANSLQND